MPAKRPKLPALHPALTSSRPTKCACPEAEMDILCLNRCYWPDVEATGQLLTELCSDLARRHHVTVIAGQPNFVDINGRQLIQREMHDGVHIIRLRNSRFSNHSLLARLLPLL